jgi:hypothetical protein
MKTLLTIILLTASFASIACDGTGTITLVGTRLYNGSISGQGVLMQVNGGPAAGGFGVIIDQNHTTIDPSLGGLIAVGDILTWSNGYDSGNGLCDATDSGSTAAVSPPPTTTTNPPTTTTKHPKK